jgi:hypothetical protein
MPSSGIWRRVDLMWTDFSGEHIASIFRVEKSACEEPAHAATCSRRFLARGFIYPENEGDRFPETSVHTRSTRHHIPEDSILHQSTCYKPPWIRKEFSEWRLCLCICMYVCIYAYVYEYMNLNRATTLTVGRILSTFFFESLSQIGARWIWIFQIQKQGPSLQMSPKAHNGDFC